MLKLVATDLDGTFLKNDKTISKENLDILHELGERGILRVVATGRNLRKVQEVIAGHVPFDYIVFSSGAGVYDCRNIGNLQKADVAIEFTIPTSAVANYQLCFEAGVPVVSGTTGWLSHHAEVIENCKKLDGTFLYASNFSLGVNIFFALNKKLAALMANRSEYKVEKTGEYWVV